MKPIFKPADDPCYGKLTKAFIDCIDTRKLAGVAAELIKTEPELLECSPEEVLRKVLSSPAGTI